MKYLLDYNFKLKRDCFNVMDSSTLFEVIDEEGNFKKYTLEELVSSDVMRLNVNTEDNDIVIIPILKQEWLCKGNAIKNFVETKEDLDKINLRLRLLNKPERYTHLINKKQNYYSYQCLKLLNRDIVKPLFLGIFKNGDSYDFEVSANFNILKDKVIFYFRHHLFEVESHIENQKVYHHCGGLYQGVYYENDWYITLEDCVESPRISYIVKLFDLYNLDYSAIYSFTGRKQSKSINFGLAYGLSTGTIMTSIYGGNTKV